MTFKIQDISITKLLHNKKFVMSISIICAVIFWGIINISESPNISKDIHNVPVTISVDGTIAESLGLDVVSGGEDRVVTVSVSGPRYIVSGLTAEDITVTAAMDMVTAAGNQSVPLVAIKSSGKSGYTITGVSPGNLTLLVDNFNTKTFDVEVKANGAAAAEGLICDTPVVSADKYAQLNVSGPRTQLDKLAKIVAEAQVNETLSATKSFDAQIRFYDINGNEMDKSLFTIDTPTVNITVPILKSKDVPIKVVFKNAPEIYSETGLSHTTNLRKVTVLGQPEEIDALEFINLAPIDFKKISETNRKFLCALEIPNGMRLAEEVADVEVNVTAPLETRTIPITKFEAVNMADGLKMAVTERTPKEVVICTAKGDVDKIKVAEVKGIVNVGGYAAGEYNVPLSISADGRDDIWVVVRDADYTLRIKLS